MFVTSGIGGLRHSSNKAVGFVGLGNMGSNMAHNLLKKGHQLIIYDIQSATTTQFEKLGVKIAPTPADVASQTDTIITMLPASAHVRNAYTGPSGILEGAKKGAITLDSSTIDPDTSKAIAAVAKLKGVSYLDCPVSGGTGAAKAGTLTFMVGGVQSDFKEIEALLLCMGAKAIHCGPVGSGQAAKICNNMLLGISMIGTAETMNLGMKMGLDPKLLAGILNSSSGRCWSSEVYNPVPGVMENVPAANDYQGGFGTALMTKDLGLAQNAAGGSGAPTPLGSLSFQIYQMMCSHGYQAKDFSAVFRFLQKTDK